MVLQLKEQLLFKLIEGIYLQALVFIVSLQEILILVFLIQAMLLGGVVP
jgi:hypothetical protein